MNSNALVNTAGDVCSACGHPFIRNFAGFDTLPLVEFIPAANIPNKKVMELLKMDPPEENIVQQKQPSQQRRNVQGDGW